MSLEDFYKEWNSPSDFIQVKTSGSTGRPKEILVEKKRMLNSAQTTCDFLNLKPLDSALLCLPLDYIAGKMVVVRSIEHNLRLIQAPITNHPLADISDKETIDFAAMVPSQVFSSLKIPAEAEKLKRIKHLIIGGGIIPNSIESILRDFPNNVWATYGMTETLSHIALRPISGKESSIWYHPLKSVKVTLTDEQCLKIDAPLVCPDILITNDIAEIAPDGKRFRILGRKDNVICSGGIKLQIEEIEEKLRPHITVPFAISKRKDEKFGEVAILVTEGKTKLPNFESILPKYWIPKDTISIEQIPMTETQKICRKVLEEIVQS